VQRINRLIGGVIVVSVIAAVAVTRSQERPGEWRYFGGDHNFTRYSPLDQINRDHVKNLRIVWRHSAVSEQITQAFPDLTPNANLRATPIMVDGILYTQNAHGLVTALDGGTGKTLWEQPLFAPTRDEATGVSTRGVDYWRGGAGNVDKRIFAIRGEYLYAVNAETGKLSPGFGTGGRMSLHFAENQPLAGRFSDTTGPLVIGNVVVVTGSPRPPVLGDHGVMDWDTSWAQWTPVKAAIRHPAHTHRL